MAHKQPSTHPATAPHPTHQATSPHATTVFQSYTVKTTISVPGTERCIEVHVRIRHGGAQTARSRVPEVGLLIPIFEQSTSTDAANNNSPAQHHHEQIPGPGSRLGMGMRA